MKLYLISPPFEIKEFNIYNFQKLTDIVDVEYFQLRPKYKKIEQNNEFIDKYFGLFRKICLEKKIKFIINDDLKIARKYKFDGIHLGQGDKSCLKARKIFGTKFIIGISCNSSLKLSIKAFEEGANYIALGPFAKSLTKLTKKYLLKRKSVIDIKHKINIPITIIGGINHKNLINLKMLKPNNFAMINSIWQYKDGPIESAKRIKRLLTNFGERN